MVNVDINYDTKTAHVSCEQKTKQKFMIAPAPGGFIFYQIAVDSGKVHKDLAGKFSSLDKAVAFLVKHLETMNATPAVARDKRSAKRKEELDAAKDNTKGS